MTVPWPGIIIGGASRAANTSVIIVKNVKKVVKIPVNSISFPSVQERARFATNFMFPNLHIFPPLDRIGKQTRVVYALNIVIAKEENSARLLDLDSLNSGGTLTDETNKNQKLKIAI